MRNIFLAIALGLVALFVCACGQTTATEKEKSAQSKVPWSRPANWENQMPGFGSAGF